METSHSNSKTVPHLATPLFKPLESIETHLLAQQTEIEQWFRQQWHKTPAPFYASIDLRNAGFKLAPVDTNLFPAGFNNLSPHFLPECVQAAQSAIEKINIDAKHILIIPENHTRNLYYLESVATLRDILQKAGYQVYIATLSTEFKTTYTISLPSGKELEFEPLIREEKYVSVQGYRPCLILLNNDLSSGQPSILQGIQQNIMPPLQLGWYSRLKSEHFAYYHDVAQIFAEKIGIDPWLIDPFFENCDEVNFMKGEGEECLIHSIETLLEKIHIKYKEYNVPHKPFVIIKADSGTYGMGVMTVHSADEIRELNRKQRKRMSSTKEGQKISKVILQEGVYTFETYGEKAFVAEPVVYTIGHFVVGGFYRVHTSRGVNENLNAPGMYFEPLVFADSCITPESRLFPDAYPNRFYAYGVIARLALLAAARELAEIETIVSDCKGNVINAST
jgi:glutamate--cysteine ligase